MKYTKSFHSNDLQSIPNLGFFGLKIYHLATLDVARFWGLFSGAKKCLPRNQSGQIERTFAYWAIVYFRQLFLNYKRRQSVFGFFTRKKLCFHFDKKQPKLVP
jgi:hypothetical protein